MENKLVKFEQRYDWNIPGLAAELSAIDTADDTFLMYTCNTVPAVFTSGAADTSYSVVNEIPVYPLTRHGNLSYCGPGVLALVTILNTRDINLTINLFRKSITDYVVAEHNIALTLNEEDPGYYDQDNRKYISIDLSVRRGILVHYVTFNYAADLSKMSGVPICGVQRSMGNLLTEPALTDAAMAAHGNKFLNYLWKNLYPNYNVTTY